jgi:formylglycine-generating enzyme required for sulfatase activity
VPPEQDASHATSKLRDTIDASNPMIPRGAIAVQRHEVTREEYAVYLASLGSADRAPATPFDAWTTDADIASLKAPVTWVTQAQSMGFCHAIEARLPTSPEWSDFARPTPSAWASPSTGYAIGQVVSATALPESVQHTGDIIEGVYDLVGNVKEWTDTTKDGLGVVRGEDFGTPSESAATALSQITQKQVGDDPKRARTFSGPRLGFRCVR